jgi:hypothetical protein
LSGSDTIVASSAKFLRLEVGLTDENIEKMRQDETVAEIAAAMDHVSKFDTSELDLDLAVPFIMEEMSMRDEYNVQRCHDDLARAHYHAAWCVDVFGDGPHWAYIESKIKDKVNETEAKYDRALTYKREGTIITDVERNPHIGK